MDLYEEMVDSAYVDDQATRAPQFDELLDVLMACGLTSSASLLDVGCGAGGLVQSASDRGLSAQGIDPSRFLVAAGREKGLALSCAPLADVTETFDAVTCIDVIEHVTDPIGLLVALRARMSPSGIVAVATPDAGSLTARLLGRRWWHIRPAHVGYFSKDSLVAAMARAGLRPVVTNRPSWYFSGRYLGERVGVYVKPIGTLLARGIGERTVRVNPHDSLLVVAKAV